MRSYFSVLVLKIHHTPLSFFAICWQSQPRSSMCTHVTTEHKTSIQVEWMFLNQPNITPFSTSSVINRICVETQPNLTYRRSTFHDQYSAPVHLNPGGYLPCWNKVQPSYSDQPPSVHLMGQGSTESGKNDLDDSFGSLLFWIMLMLRSGIYTQGIESSIQTRPNCIEIQVQYCILSMPTELPMQEVLWRGYSYRVQDLLVTHSGLTLNNRKDNNISFVLQQQNKRQYNIRPPGWNSFVLYL
jgi:hypothetical protein